MQIFCRHAGEGENKTWKNEDFNEWTLNIKTALYHYFKTTEQTKNKNGVPFVFCYPCSRTEYQCEQEQSEKEEISFVEAMVKGYQAYKDS